MLNKVHPVIRRALTVFISVSVISTTAVIVSGTYREDFDKDERSEKRAMRIWKNKIDGSRESSRIIDEYENSYTGLVNNFIVGEENRLSWYEAIQSTAKARGLASIKYKVDSQKAVVDTSGYHKKQGLKVFRSVMTLDMKISHEGDLFAILNTLENKAKGLFTVDRCKLERFEKTAKSTQDNMKAFCEISWYTFKSADEKKKG